jgi:hypothetical protein
MSYVSVKGLGDIAACPDGTHQVCMVQRPGDTSPPVCMCQPIRAGATQAAMASSVNHHWGLIAGVALGAFIVYKVATR